MGRCQEGITLYFKKLKPPIMKDHLLGGIDPALFAACFIAALVGAFFILLMGTRLREPFSLESPSKFSWEYLFSDNFKRILANILAILIVLRFMPEILNTELTMWKGLLVGIASDSLALLIKQKTTFFDPKTKTETTKTDK